MSKLVDHNNYSQYLTAIEKHKCINILEIGSREVTGNSDAHKGFSKMKYIGFDYYPGKNIDVFGASPKFTQYLGDEKLDIIYSSAVFEHLAMPWLDASEIAKLMTNLAASREVSNPNPVKSFAESGGEFYPEKLKIGGIIFVETQNA